MTRWWWSFYFLKWHVIGAYYTHMVLEHQKKQVSTRSDMWFHYPFSMTGKEGINGQLVPNHVAQHKVLANASLCYIETIWHLGLHK